MRSIICMCAVLAVAVAAELHTNPGGGLTVHEWGTFTSVAGADGSAVNWDTLGGDSDLPHFVHSRGYPCFKFRLFGTVRMETPVLYFYSAQPLDAHVRVAFPKGLITEWYPEADYQVDQSQPDGSLRRLGPNLDGLDISMQRVTGGIEWKSIHVEPHTSPALPFESSSSHYYAARATESTPLTVAGQREKFLFYRGVGRVAVPLKARLGDGKVEVSNLGAEPVPMLMLFENRGGRMGYRLADGSVAGSITLDAPALEGSLATLRSDLENAIEAQGLFRQEAQAMVETWKDSWFEEGSRLIYIVPARTVDAILPLLVAPAPTQISRVFVGRLELITPEAMHAVERALATNDRSFAKSYGRFLDTIFNRIAGENPAMATAIEKFRAGIPFIAACR